jgi:hypothetical protein
MRVDQSSIVFNIAWLKQTAGTLFGEACATSYTHTWQLLFLPHTVERILWCPLASSVTALPVSSPVLHKHQRQSTNGRHLIQSSISKSFLSTCRVSCKCKRQTKCMRLPAASAHIVNSRTHLGGAAMGVTPSLAPLASQEGRSSPRYMTWDNSGLYQDHRQNVMVNYKLKGQTMAFTEVRFAVVVWASAVNCMDSYCTGCLQPANRSICNLVP